MGPNNRNDPDLPAGPPGDDASANKPTPPADGPAPPPAGAHPPPPEEAETVTQPPEQVYGPTPRASRPSRSEKHRTKTPRYKITRRIGEGGMGEVYEARQAKPARKVALKMIRAGYASHHALKRFEYEAELLGKLKHPGIAAIHEAADGEMVSDASSRLRTTRRSDGRTPSD